MQESTSSPAAPTQGINLLLVDDSATMRMMLRRVIDLSEVPVGSIFEASNGREAVAVLEAQDVHAVFTDINMPVMSGYELLHLMSRTDKWRHILRIVISTDGSTLRKEEVRELSVNLYIQKPFRPEMVRNVLARLTHAHAH
jgi:two-component system, chemotaxis family, chemotaxis protein CheY